MHIPGKMATLAVLVALMAVLYVSLSCSLPMLLCLGLLALYFLTENWWWHRTPSREGMCL